MVDLDILPSGPPTLRVKLGGEALTLTGGRLSNAINDRATASIEVNLEHLQPVDYSGPVTIHVAGSDELRFTGHIVSAHTDADGTTRMEAESGRDLVESRLGHVQTTGVTHVETFHLITRLGGYTDDRLSIQGLDEIPLEAMVIEMPLTGLHVDEPFTLLGVEFRPWADPNLFTDAYAANPSHWDTPTAVARVYTVGTLMFNAEQAVLPKVHTAVDALLTTATYGLSRDTNDQELPFQRDRLLSRPAVVPLIGTQAVASQRRWVHELRDYRGREPLPLEDHYRQWASVLSTEPPSEAANAMRALRDAADDTRLLDDRCHHLWAALEFYAGKASPPKEVSKKTLKDARQAINALVLPERESERLLGLIDRANEAPLMARIRYQATVDGAPTTKAEWDHLARLRASRNRTVHGAQSQPITEDDLRWGLSIASRFILCNWMRSQDRQLNTPRS